jgi:periplasmic protein TonB
VYVSRPPRASAATASLTIVALLALVLVFGLGGERGAIAPGTLVAFELSPPRPHPTEEPKPRIRPSKSSAAKRKASPRNVRNKATQVVAPRNPLLIVPPPIVTAPQAGVGSAANTGASDRPGPGRGAGGIGSGDGGGGNGGDGEGAGDGGGAVVGPRRLHGRLAYDDLPMGVLRLGEEATVEVRYTVNPDGRASKCRAVRSSGYSLLDTLACQLIEKRFRFRPARNRSGRPVAADIVESHTWVEDGEATVR